MKVVSFASSKGGVGKSTLSILCARYLAALGHRVLCVDLDIQNSLTFYFAPSHHDIEDKNIIQAFAQADLQPHILKARDNIWIVASGLNLERLKILDAYALKNLLKPLNKHFDFCIIDTSPILFQLIVNCTCASDLIITPLSQSLFEWKSATIFYKNLNRILENHSHKWRLLFNKYQTPRSLNPNTLLNQYGSLFQESFQNQILNTVIPIIPSLTKFIDTNVLISRDKILHNKIFESIQSLSLEIFQDTSVLLMAPLKSPQDALSSF